MDFDRNTKFYVEFGEAKEILISVLAISFAFTIVYAGLGSLIHYPQSFFLFAGLAVVTVGSGFILHEMAHKVVAIYYGAYARFQMWLYGLLFMFVTSIFGFLFAAPGAVYIYSNTITKKENGLISLVGPVVNVFVAIIFLFLESIRPVTFFFPFFRGALHVWDFGAQINIVLALFNMLPMFPLDGSKVFAWNKLVWGAFVLFSLAFGYFIFGSISIIFMWVILLVITLIFSRALF